LFEEVLNEQQVSHIKRFESERLADVASSIAKAWRRDGIKSRIAASSFSRWLSGAMWPGELTDKELLEFAMSRGS